MIKDDLLKFLNLCVVAHHIPGRLRVKLSNTAKGLPSRAEADRILTRIRSTPGINRVSINLPARSCTLEYDPAAIAPTAWDDLFAARVTGETDALALHLQAGGGA